MDVSFDEAAAALRDLAHTERTRIQFTREEAVRGRVEPPPETAFAGWVERLRRLEAVARLLTVIGPAEADLRTRYPELGLAQPPPEPPTLWR